MIAFGARVIICVCEYLKYKSESTLVAKSWQVKHT